MTENLPILIGNSLFLISLFGLYMKLLDSISILNSKQGIVTSKHELSKSFHCNGKFSYGTYFTTTTPFLEFSIQFQSNNLIYDKGYNKRQQMIYSLILLLREEGLGYRKISYKLNDWGIKTHRGKQWFDTSVSSVLKKKHERDVLFDEIRNRHYPTEISKFEVNYYIFD